MFVYVCISLQLFICIVNVGNMFHSIATGFVLYCDFPKDFFVSIHVLMLQFNLIFISIFSLSVSGRDKQSTCEDSKYKKLFTNMHIQEINKHQENNMIPVLKFTYMFVYLKLLHTIST